MLQELLLSLSGFPSPLSSFKSDGANGDHGPFQSLLSPAELVLLTTLSEELGERHKNTRAHASRVSSSHPSIVCRAVAAAVISMHLAAFQQKILEVERNILTEDASLVGAYNTVPLSAIVSAFDGWGRKLRWLWELVQFIQQLEKGGQGQEGHGEATACTAAGLIQRLRDTTHSGFPSIAEMSLSLVRVAEMAWLKQISAWVLYGQHPGGPDFFVRQDADPENGAKSSYESYHILSDHVPCFVSPATARSVLFIGKSLNHIKDRQASATEASYRYATPDFAMLPQHLAHLSVLQPPIATAAFTEAVNAIRLSLSQNALQKLLPLPKVLETLEILLDFFLLERGEFAVALITAADDRLSSRHDRYPTGRLKTKGINDLASLTIRDGEVQNVLSRTWTALASLQSGDEDGFDEELDLARELVSLSIKTTDSSSRRKALDGIPVVSQTSFDDLLLPSASVLRFQVVSPLDLLLTNSDIDGYSSIQAYLLAIRRAHLHLSQLFQLSSLRRKSPTFKGKDVVSPQAGEQRHRATEKVRSMRPVWATISSAAFFLAEVGEYFQGEVIQSSWNAFYSWLVPNVNAHSDIKGSDSLSSSFRPTSSHIGSRPPSSRQSGDALKYGIHDPEALSQAHKSYLSSISHSILLDDADFTSRLRRQMTAIDHICALMQRLDVVQRNIRAESASHDDVPLSHFASEERTLMADLRSSRVKLADGVKTMIASLREIDNARAGSRNARHGQELAESDFVPWSSNGLDRLLLKFDYGNVEGLLPADFGHG